MSRMVKCVKLNKEAEGLDFPPYPGELGQRIYESISKEAWQQWQRQQTMLINENRLSMVDPRAQKLLREEMERFLFGEGSAPPAGYVPPST
jgi:Fe-S cluster biosynthesis and repair protein YggX